MNTPVFRIGVSGHQNLGDEATQHFVAQQFSDLLDTYKQQKGQVLLYSALAKGADQLFVRAALDAGVPVEIVLPCAAYGTIFPSEEEKAEYRRLLDACQAVHQLPAQECTDDAYLAAGRWIVDHSDVLILAWNGLLPLGRGGTGDIASYARSIGRLFVHLNTLSHTVTTYPDRPIQGSLSPAISPKRTFTIAKQPIYQGPTLTVNQYHLRMPDGREVVRDVVERPESVLIVPIGQQDLLLLIEEYNFGAGVWQLTLPGGKVEKQYAGDRLEDQAQKELRQETGYEAKKLEKLISLYSHPGYISHTVHIFVASELQWNPLDTERHEEIRTQVYTLKEALAATAVDYRCDPQAALALWLYAQKRKTS